MTKDGSKVKHFLAIVEVYALIRSIEEPRILEVEPKYGKGNPEPDLFMIWRKNAAFVEIQRSYYNAKKYEDKFERYEKYYYSDEWKSLPWQPEDKKIFPKVWIIGEQRFNWEPEFKVIQSKGVDDILKLI